MASAGTNHLTQAVVILRAGGLVAIPTETVYGLAADATSSAAVQKIFTAKGRPSTNPLIVHVADESSARRYASVWSDAAHTLAAAFWPGPLTLVLPTSPLIVPEVTAGRDTVGLRVPNHPLTLELLKQFDGPLAAPSANRSNHVSPTTAQHVRAELGDRADLILDGGPCTVGIESTVLDVSTASPAILRPGGVSRQMIEQLIGPVALFTGSVDRAEAATSPGQHRVHYSPSAPMFRFEPSNIDRVADYCRTHSDRQVLILALSPPNQFRKRPSNIDMVQMPSEPEEYARNLYRILHDADERQVSAIWVEMPPDQPAWLAIRDRLIRASIES